MDTARLADQSWPDRNPRFTWPPDPPNRKRPGRDTGALSKSKLTDPAHTPAELAAQRAIACAMRRAARIDRVADLLLSVGRVDAAERLSRVAADLREVAA